MMDFKKNLTIDFKDNVENVEGKSYLTWAVAWEAIRKDYPDVTYKIHRGQDGIPVFDRPGVGAFVWTEITAGGETHDMMLPVMDSKFKAMKSELYEYTTKYGKKIVNSYDSHDINRAIMRCLAKNIAMFGYALYLYQGEDYPNVNEITALGPVKNEWLDRFKQESEKYELTPKITEYINGLKPETYTKELYLRDMENLKGHAISTIRGNNG